MTNRITGIMSGFDTENLVKELMSVEKTRVDNVKAQKQLLEWKQSDYRNVNTKLLALRNAVSDLRYQSTFMTKSVSSSNDKIATAVAKSSVAAGTYTIKVHQLASGVYKGSTQALGSAKDATTLAEQFGISGTITFTLAGYDGEETVSQEFTFDTAESSLADVINAINQADIGIFATYDATADRFFLSTTGTGSAYKIHATADEQGFLTDTLKLDLTVGEELAASDQGVDALIDFNGVTGLTYSSNQITLNGITMNLQDTGEVRLTVSHDTSAIKEKIKNFVNAYNDAMDLIYNELKEERKRSYQPLTDEQKEEMTEEQIKKWEEAASSGMLRGDYLLRQIQSSLRSLATGMVDGISGKYNNLSAIGIATEPYKYDGKLKIDEEELDAALADNLEAVMNLFTKSAEETGYSQGIAMRLYYSVTDSMDSIYEVAGSADATVDDSTIGKQLAEYKERIADLNERLNDIEDRYYAQFAAMEKALSSLNSSASMILSLFGNNSNK